MTKPGREFTAEASTAIEGQLERLLQGRQSTQAYREAMTELGASLGREVRSRINVTKPFALVSTPEDADYLVTGMLKALPHQNARLVCYWTERKEFVDGDLATVIQQYFDPRMGSKIDTVIVAKAIISSGCIVKTHLENFLLRAQPNRVVIAAPVMVKSAEKQLRAAFAREISERFEFVVFAKDPAPQTGKIVTPGVGGMVEELLGLQSKTARFSPTLVSSWRESAAVS